MRKTISVRYAMTRNPVIVGPLVSVEECAKKMLKEGVGSLIVEENGRLKGIVTEKDFIEKIVAKGIDAKKVSVENIMTSTPAVIEPERDVMEAIKLMNEKKVRRLPVVKEGKLIGLLTVHDILKIQPEMFELIIEKSKVNPSEIEFSNEGECEICGNFTVLHKKRNKGICDECDN